jgi:hypothetical protein
MSQIEIKTVAGKKDVMKFIKMPWQIYKDDPNWVPPLIIDRKKLLDKTHNPFFKHAEMEMFLAYKDGELCGRIAAITNENHNKFHEDNMGFFGFFEAENDPEIAKALLDTAKNWVKEKGKNGMFGPMNPSTNDETGLLVDGFDTPPFIMMTYNPPYYKDLYEGYGLEKAKDLLAWFWDIRGVEFPEKLVKIADVAKRRSGIKLRNLKLKDLRSELELVLEVYNNAWSKNWGFVPMTKEEILHAADDLKQIADEDYLFIAEKDGKPVAFSVTLPNINEVLIKIKNGKLFPTGIFKLLTGIKKTKSVRVLMLGVVKELQNAGLGPLFYLESFKVGQRKGIIGGEFSWILEDNIAMNKGAEAMGATISKTYRVYQQMF